MVLIERKIIVASHGEMAAGMVNSAKMILGSLADNVRAYGLFPGKTASEFAEELKEEICKGEYEFIILTDLYQASVCTAMGSLLHYPNVRLFTGMNLALLITLCADYEEELTDGDVEKVIAESREGLRCIRLQDLQTEEEEF